MCCWLCQQGSGTLFFFSFCQPLGHSHLPVSPLLPCRLKASSITFLKGNVKLTPFPGFAGTGRGTDHLHYAVQAFARAKLEVPALLMLRESQKNIPSPFPTSRESKCLQMWLLALWLCAITASWAPSPSPPQFSRQSTWTCPWSCSRCMNNFVMHLGASPSRAPNLSSVLLLGPPFWCLLALFSKVLLCAGGEHEDTKLCSWGRASWECWALCKERRGFFFFFQ